MDNSVIETGTQSGATVRGTSGIDHGNAAQDLDPANIESVSVLQGANAAALYGSRAANGVVLITTKSGRTAGPGLGITASTHFTLETPLKIPAWQNKWGGGSTDSGYNWVNGRGGGLNDGVDESWGPALDGTPYVQWWSDGTPQPFLPSPYNTREYMQTGSSFTNNFAIARSTDRTNLRFSALRLDAAGTAPNHTQDRTQLALNAGAAVSERFNVDASAQYTQATGHNRPGVLNGSYSALHIFMWFQRQVDMKRMERANRLWDPNSGTLTPNWNHNYHDNVYWLQEFRTNDDTRDRVTGQVTASYELLPWLNARFRAGTDWYNHRTMEIYPFYAQDSPEGGFTEASVFRQETNAEVLFTANRNLTSDLNLTASFGGNRRLNDFDQKAAGTRKLNVPNIYNVSNSAAPPLLDNLIEKKRVNSLYGLTTLGYKEYAFLDVTARNDWSSTLPEDDRSYFYPSFSGSLVFTDAFNMEYDWLSYGKVRASWARVGNDADPYQLASVYNETEKFGNVPGFTTSNRIPNSGLRPETTESWEVGADIRFANDRASMDFTYYNSETKDQILAVDISETSGYTSQVLNAGTVKNTGVEVLLNVDLFRFNNGLEWSVTTNFAKNNSEVTELAPGLQSLVIGGGGGMTVEARPGEPYGVMYGTEYVRDSNGKVVVDAGGRPKRSSEKVPLGQYQPDWMGGWMNTFRYRAMTLSALFDIRRGGEIMCGTCRLGSRTGLMRETADRPEGGLVFPGVNEDGSPNTTAQAPRSYWRGIYNVTEPWIYENNWVKLREVALGFDLPQNLVQRTGLPISRARMSIIGRNLWLWTDVPHIDPETGRRNNNFQGYEFEQWPTSRSFGINVDIVM
jgi:TonB-linked SusC/RagA family outer membrane protein